MRANYFASTHRERHCLSPSPYWMGGALHPRSAPCAPERSRSGERRFLRWESWQIRGTKEAIRHNIAGGSGQHSPMEGFQPKVETPNPHHHNSRESSQVGSRILGGEGQRRFLRWESRVLIMQHDRGKTKGGMGKRGNEGITQ